MDTDVLIAVGFYDIFMDLEILFTVGFYNIFMDLEVLFALVIGGISSVVR